MLDASLIRKLPPARRLLLTAYCPRHTTKCPVLPRSQLTRQYSRECLFEIAEQIIDVLDAH